MAKSTTHSCTLCGHSSSVRWPHHKELPLYQCDACTLVYLVPEHSIDVHFDAMEEDFFSEGYLRRRSWFTERFLIHKAKRRLNLLHQWFPSGRLLDVGTGTGELLPVAHAMGYTVEGLDYSARLVEYVRQKYGLPVSVGDLGSMESSTQHDAVFLNHVIEHVTDPRETLAQIRSVLKPDGLVFIATPNIACWEARWKGWGSYEPYHLSYFSPTTLPLALEQSGFSLMHLTTWDPYSAWFNTFLRTALPRPHSTAREQVHRSTDSQTRALFHVAMAVLNSARFLSGLALSPLRYLQERKGRGEELIAIARVS